MPPRRRRDGDVVNGMLLLDKPSGLSSNQALQKAKRLLNAQKAGHTGSLDPIATGLLPLCFGQATKISGMFLNADKCYQVKIQLGVKTDSGDCEGTIIEQPEGNAALPALPQIEKALQQFRGRIEQIPPMYCALKRHGQPLYKLARQGIEVPRQPRWVTVYDLSIIDFQEDFLTLIVSCSKGFYIRSLAMDLGQALGCGGHVHALRRVAVGAFTIDQAVTLEQLEALESPQHRQRLLLPADHALAHLPKVALTAKTADYFCQGQPVRTLKPPKPGMARIYAEDNSFLGLGEVVADGTVSPKRLFV
ncbi:tRNA pseudouridine(55) synthase TruB [Candidatus Spongiihabitans sp.]|uniref:tRNA pseudouridine(55) synthase TruB n=1 Tax=Candidatus Spongiihabitans sp. TaxID=3101308 RepID=UPI003C7E4165